MKTPILPLLAAVAVAMLTGCTATSQDFMALSGVSRTCAVISANNGNYQAAAINDSMAELYERQALFLQQQEQMELQRQQVQAFMQALIPPQG